MSNKLKHKIDKNFTTVSNQIFKDTRLSFKAKGLFCQILSLPENWQFTVNGLCALADDGRDGVKHGLEELKKYGYLVWNQEKQQGKFVGNTVETHYPITEKPFTDFPLTESPLTEKPHNKEYNNKEYNNKELNNTTRDEEELLKIVNQTLGREFRVLPRGTRKTLDTFTLQEIETALKNLAVDAWHSERLPTLKLDYLLRATTIDKFRLEESVQVEEKVAHMRLNLETGKMEEVYE